VRLYRERIDWWREMEIIAGATWARPYEIPLQALIRAVDGEQPEMELPDEALSDCFCHE
jgi:hypothetical protein